MYRACGCATQRERERLERPRRAEKQVNMSMISWQEGFVSHHMHAHQMEEAEGNLRNRLIQREQEFAWDERIQIDLLHWNQLQEVGGYVVLEPNFVCFDLIRYDTGCQDLEVICLCLS